MRTTIQQLEDLKEWSKDSTRYERRLAFRSSQYAPGSMGTEAGTIPIEFDELSDREREYYRKGPWSTREDYSKGQLVQPGPGRIGFQDGSESKKYPQTYRLVEGAEYIYKRKSVVTGKTGAFIVEITYYPLKKNFEPVKYTKTFGVDEHGGIAKALAAAKEHLPQAKKMISAEVGLPFKDILDYTKTRERRARFQLPKGKKHYLNTAEFAKALTKLGLPATKMIHQKLYSYKEGTSEWIGPILKKLFDPTTIRKEGSKMKSGNMFWKPPTEADIPKLKPYITYGGEGKGEGFLKKNTLNNLRDLHNLPYIKNLRKRMRPLDLRNKAIIKFARQKNLTPTGLLWLFRQLARRYKGEVIPGLEYIPVNKPFGKIVGKNIIDLFEKPFGDPYWRGMNQLRYLIEADYLEDAGEFKEAERYKEFSKKAELTKFRGQAEHGLGVGAVRAGLAPRDTLIKINAFLDPKVNSWKGVNFDMALFGKEALLDKYNNARSRFGILESPEQKILKQKILERFEWMRKRAPKLIDMIELNWEGNQVSARSNTPALDTLTKEQRIKLHADGMKESQRIIKSQGLTEKGTALKTGFKDTGYKLNKNLKVPVPKGTLGSFASAAGVPLFGIASGAMYQEGKPKKDILLGLPVEFGSFGLFPVTEMMQQWRIRDDLKKKGLSFKERNEELSKYNRAKGQLAMDADVGMEGAFSSWALEGLPKDQIEKSLSIREDEEKRLLDTKIQRGYDVETGTWPDKDPIAFEEAPYAEGGTVPRTGYQTAGSVGKAAGKGILRKALGWFGADIGFYYLEKWNEMSKGKSEEEAAAMAMNNATLGVYKNKEYIKQLKKTAEEMGIDSRAFENVYKMNEKTAKVQKEHQRYQGMIEKLEGMEAGPERDARLEQITNAYNNWQESMDPEIRKWVQGILDDISISKTGGIASPLELSKARESLTEDDWDKPFIDIQDVALEKLEKEKAAAYDMQSKQVDPEAGNIGNILNIFPFSLSPIERAKEQGRINDMLDFDPKELYRYNKARGLDPDNPLTWEAYKTLKSAHPGLGFREEDAGGGIAGLLKK